MRFRIALLTLAISTALLASLAPATAVSSPTPIAIDVSVTHFKRVIFYYGWLNTARNLPTISFDILVFAGSVSNLSTWLSILEELHSKGVQLYVYLHDNSGNPIGLGETFKTMVVDNSSGTLEQRVAYWKSFIEGLIREYAAWSDSHGRILTGVFLDECDPSYFGYTNPSNTYVKEFSEALKQIVSYAHSLGLKVFINGVRAYASLGDYYLWEDFVATYNPSTGSYSLDTSFFTSSSTNPYQWVNGLAKYEYLKQHNLLSRTIALSYADPSHLSYAIAAYYAARVLGLAGWAFAPGDIYANGGDVLTAPVYEVGQPLTPPSIDPSAGTVSRLFTVGNVTVNILSASVKLPFSYVPGVQLDGYLDPCYTTFTSASAGTYSKIALYGYTATPQHLYILVESTWSSIPTTDGVLHIYIDSDGDSSTGYSIYGIGADYLVEVYADGTAHLYNYSGSGTTWSWSDLGAIPIREVASGSTLRIEVELPSTVYTLGKTRIVIATVYSWNDDSVTSVFTVSRLYVPTPTIFDSYAAYSSYYPIVTRMAVSSSRAVIVLSVPSGKSYLVNCSVVLPIPDVRSVLKNGVPLKRFSTPSFSSEGWYSKKLASGETLVEVLVDPSTTVTLVVLGPSAAQAGGGAGSTLGGYASSEALYPLAILAAAFVGVALALARRRGA